jgi:hypothetical protein
MRREWGRVLSIEWIESIDESLKARRDEEKRNEGVEYWNMRL